MPSAPAAEAPPTAPSADIGGSGVALPPLTGSTQDPAISLPSFPAPAAPVPPPYNDAVAARFPAPSVVYSTPGLQAGRTTFSSATEIQAWLRDQQRQAVRTGAKAAVVSLGTTGDGQPIEALVLTRSVGADPLALNESQRPTVLLAGQRQGDAAASSEALLVVARELAQGLLRPLLDRINVIVLPALGSGAGITGASVSSVSSFQPLSASADSGKDHLLLETPQARALARVVRDYQPVVVLEAHEYPALGKDLQTFGMLPKADLRFSYAMSPNLPEFLIKASDEWFRRPLIAALKPQSLNAEWAHTSSGNPANQQVLLGNASPDTLVNAQGLKNVISLRIESRGLGLDRLHLQRRVHTQVTAMGSVLNSTAQRADELGQLRPYLEAEVAAQACRDEVTVAAEPTPAELDLTLIDPVTALDRVLTVQSQSALALRKVRARIRPCGYWLAPEATAAVERLRMHGVKVMRLSEPGSMLGDLYRARGAGVAAVGGPSGAGSDALAEVSLLRGLIDTPQGSFYVPLDQPVGNLVVAALEPDGPASYVNQRLLPGLQSVARIMTKPAGRLEELP
jgi:hypothetical protein